MSHFKNQILESRVRWQAPKYSRGELKDRWNKCRYQRHRWFAWRPVAIPRNDRSGKRIGREYVVFRFVERQFHYPSWSYHNYAGARSLRQLVYD
jgi:hypothetical protein